MSASKFDPNAAASADSGIFGLPTSRKEAQLVLVPVPWEATTSYGGGTSQGPKAILEASRQVDLFDLELGRVYESGIYLERESAKIRAWNKEAKREAQKVIRAVEAGKKPAKKSLEIVNRLGARLNAEVARLSQDVLNEGKILGIIGGDHAVPFGAISAVAEKHPGLGILHFDAHSDTRKAYEGFEWSHASIFHNVLTRLPTVSRVVQVGIRDFCEEEYEFIRAHGDRMRVFFDRDLARSKIEGHPWRETAREIVDALPREVWVSFDIDGLDPRFCPNTGTPVPGGLDFHEATYILAQVARSGRKIVGFDLNEVAPGAHDEWDANVGARMLYQLCGWTFQSRRPQRDLMSGARSAELTYSN